MQTTPVTPSQWDALMKKVQRLPTKLFYGTLILGTIYLASNGKIPPEFAALASVTSGIGFNILSNKISQFIDGNGSDDDIHKELEQAIKTSNIETLLQERDFIRAYVQLLRRLETQAVVSKEILSELKTGLSQLATATQVEELTQMLDERLPEVSRSFSNKWFENHVKESIADAEASRRYLPELNVDLPVGRLFDSLGRTDKFFDRVFNLIKDVRKKHNDLFRWKISNDFLKDTLEVIRQKSTTLVNTLESIEKQTYTLLPFDEIGKQSTQVIDSIDQTKPILSSLIEEPEYAQTKTQTGEKSQASEEIKQWRYRLHDLQQNIDSLRHFCNSNEAILANQPYLLLTGEGGIGKTHLFCEVANQRIKENMPTILLLGEKFQNIDPWRQIIDQLKLGTNHSLDEYLQSLNDFAFYRNSRLLIMIDALNEGEDIGLWYKYLGSFLHKIKHYPQIAVALSIRAEYKEHMIPDDLLEQGQLIEDYHSGFTGLVNQAVQKYFTYYGIEYSVPPLESEFQNPLFLQTLCKGLRDSNQRSLPTGLQGFTDIVEFFITSVNQKLARELKYHQRKNHVKSAIYALIEEMSAIGTIYVSESRAEEIVNHFLPNPSNQFTTSLYERLISEGVLYRTIYNSAPSVRLLYDRFTDHLIAQRLLEKHIDLSDPARAFDVDQPLGELLTHKSNFGIRYGLIPAFAIQIPEITGLELFQVAPYLKNEQDLASAITSSLVWRQWNSQNISESLIEFINNDILTNSHKVSVFWETILSVTASPRNPFNADFLHRNLLDHEMAERDAWWSIFLHYNYDPTDDDQKSINRLINWAWSDIEKSSINRESTRLLGTALAWFLTSSNRFLRDRATKALTCLFESQLPILITVLDQFISVNDPYILERLFAVAYGCAMRSNDTQGLESLAQQVFKWLFSVGAPPPHILLRDYARGVIEVALEKCPGILIPMERVRPPYSIDWIVEPPSQEKLEDLYKSDSRDLSDEERSMRKIHHSVMDWDFGNYIVHDVRYWTDVRLQEELPKSPKEQYEQFLSRLHPEKLSLWNQYEMLVGEVDMHFEALMKKLMDKQDPEIDLSQELIEEESNEYFAEMGIDESYFDEKSKALLQEFLILLSPEERLVFESNILPFVEKNGLSNIDFRDDSEFDVGLAKRWILNRVIELGWTTERFGEFDHYLDYRRFDRGGKKVERFGKKYQWIAYHELLARIADNFHYLGESWDKLPKQYEGTWQLALRDIDTSFLGTKTLAGAEKPSWWFASTYDQWNGYESPAQWVETVDDLPEVESLIEVKNPRNGSQWLNLDAVFEWREPVSPIEDEYERPRREVWYMLKSYLVKRENADSIVTWASNQDFMERWMPEAHGVHNVFLGEFFWSPAYRYNRTHGYGNEDWEQDKNNAMPGQVCVTSDKYTHNDGFDCSIDEVVTVKTPSRWLAEHMDLAWRGKEGMFHNKLGDLVCLDPSVSVEGPSSLLINRDLFLKFLAENNLEVMWTLRGEKLIIDNETNKRLTINGVYRIQNAVVVGSTSTSLR